MQIMQKNVLERPAVLELLVLGLFRPFDKFKFSIDRRFQKCIIVVKVFRDNSENSTLILTSNNKILLTMNRQEPKWQAGMRGLNLSTKHQVKKNISDILFDDRINFPNLFGKRTELPPSLRKRHFMLATLPCHFCFESWICFMCDNDTQRHANKGAQQIAIHRLEQNWPFPNSILKLRPRLNSHQRASNIGVTNFA